MERPRVLVAGLSTRAFAESAVRAGYPVAAVDAFGDLDHPATPALSLARDLGARYSPRAAALSSRELACDLVAYTSSFENHPLAVELLARGRTLLGNSPNVLAQVRDPLELARALEAGGHPTLAIRATPPRSSSRPSRPEAMPPHIRWLSKPRASGGGHGISLWTPGRPLPRGRVLQEYVDGVPASLAFLASGNDAIPFALSRQLVGESAFGASGFKYCGNILACGAGTNLGHEGTRDRVWRSILERAREIAATVAARFGLAGVNGLDFIVRDGIPYVIEVNPRYSASMELAERMFAFSVFYAHREACRGRLPRFDLDHALGGRGEGDVAAIGKAVLFARRAITVGDTRPWLEDDFIRDVPHPGERIPRGRPICTIFAAGRTDAECHAALVRRARALYEELEAREGRRRSRWRIA